MTDLNDVLAERSARHAREAKAMKGADLSYKVEDGVHYVTWHTQRGYAFLSEAPDNQLALWHSIYADADAPARVERLLERARHHGLRIYNDLPQWRRKVPGNDLLPWLGVAAIAGLLFALTRMATNDRGGQRWSSARESDQEEHAEDVSPPPASGEEQSSFAEPRH